MRFSHVILTYFVIGAIMWGGGAIMWDSAGVGGFIIDDPTTGGVDANESTADDLENMGGPIQQSLQQLGGPLLAVWNFIVKLIGYVFWPITVLQSANAPPRVTVLLGGSFSMAFIGATVRLIRGSA
ncbi:hypothetical protein [Halomicrobium urmianum]|uniref:hypothetical protein n=1 Tax=Halomicrobium urmianum TaxID=1586233 RepID=UPI001CD9856C|nr:hypothetical protein [Halomicrobium urmianum]